MLEPSSRSLITESLRPPTGFRFDCAVVTTFSLDLVAMMTAPMAFTFYDCEDAEGDNITDPLPLLEAVRRHSSNITVFCHAGRIALPSKYRPLFAYLEDSILECLPRGERGAFHPKMWALRYVNDAGQVAYRLLVLSRNLTFDKSWDVSLQLDGALTKRVQPNNKPLAEFVKALPSFARREVSQRRLAQVKLVASELRKVEWDGVPGFDKEIFFWPMGLTRGGTRPLRGRIDRLLVVSPFVNKGFWDVAGDGSLKPGAQNTLVARAEEIDALGEGSTAFGKLFALREDDLPVGDGQEELEQSEASQPSGLHAKIFVGDAGWKTRWWVGSANATDAAFTRNVELLVELTGSVTRLGTEALLRLPGKEDKQVTLRSLLEEYLPEPEDPEAIEATALERVLDDARYTLGQAAVVATVSDPVDTAYDVTVTVNLPKTLSAKVEIFARLLSIGQDREARIEDAEGSVVFRRLPIEMLSPFVVFHIRVSDGDREKSCSFVRRVELLNSPVGREEAAIRSVLKNKSEVLRYLLFLLAAEGADGFGSACAAALTDRSGTSSARSLFQNDSLFESLARALARDPARILTVKKLVDELSSADNTDLLPERFEEIWNPVWAAYEQMKEAAE